MIGWAVEALIASALLMAAVLVLRAPVRRAFGAQVAYALWALPALRWLLPPLPADWGVAAASPIARAGERIAVLVVPAGDAAPAAGWGGGAVLLALWLAGAAAFLGWHLVRHHRFCAALLADAVELEARGQVRVVASAAAAGPLAFGIWRRYVAFPRDIAQRFDADEQALALDHELGHHARGDLLANWAALALLALHWFNPLAWRAFHAFRADQELANDARVLAGRTAAERHRYACAIVKAAHGGAVSAACHLHTIHDLKGRLKMLSVSRASRRRLVTGAATVSLLACTGLALTVSSSRAAAAISGEVGRVTGIELQAAPTPPAPPTPPAVGTEPGSTSQTTTTRTRDGRTVRTRVIQHTPPGVAPMTQAEIDAAVARGMAAVPQVSERPCRVGTDGPDDQLVVNTKDGKKRIMVVCTNRIERVAAAGSAAAANAKATERQALESALAGLRSAREAVQTADMTAEARTKALAGIDEGLAEVQADLARAN